VQLVNKEGGETYASNIINYNVETGEITSGIKETATTGNIKRTTFFNIAGTHVTPDTKGLLIKMVEYDDGTVESLKIINK